MAEFDRPSDTLVPRWLMVAGLALLAVAFLAALAICFAGDAVEPVLGWAIVVAITGVAGLAYALQCRAGRRVQSLEQRIAELSAHNFDIAVERDARTAELAGCLEQAELEQQRIDAVLRETGHRIGNALATVSSLLALQALRSPSDEVRHALDAARNRVHAVASSHRRVRPGRDTDTILTSEFLPAVIDDLAGNLAGPQRITISSDVQSFAMTARYATTLGILLSELVTNCIKHAFKTADRGTIVIRLERIDGIPHLSVADDGSGLQPGVETSETALGLVIVKQLAVQFGGVPRFDRPKNGGTTVMVSLPKLEAKTAMS